MVGRSASGVARFALSIGALASGSSLSVAEATTEDAEGPQKGLVAGATGSVASQRSQVPMGGSVPESVGACSSRLRRQQPALGTHSPTSIPRVSGRPEGVEPGALHEGTRVRGAFEHNSMAAAGAPRDVFEWFGELTPALAACYGIWSQGLPLEWIPALLAFHVIYLTRRAQRPVVGRGAAVDTLLQQGGRSPQAILDVFYACLTVMPLMRPENEHDPYYLPNVFFGEVLEFSYWTFRILGAVFVLRLFRALFLEQ